MKSYTHRRTYLNLLIISIMILSAGTVSMQTASAQTKQFLPPGYGYSTNYYDSFGEPDIYASVLGDTEFERGETAQIRIVLANKGMLHGFSSDKSVGTDEEKHSISLKELEYEAFRTTALGIKATLVSNTGYIDIDPDTSSQTLEELVPGDLPDRPLTYTIKISNNAPAGDYMLMLPISYEYQSQVEMTNGDMVQLGLPYVDHTTHYTGVNRTIPIPIHIKESANFQVSDVSGGLKAGSEGTINITYKNIGESPAQDAVARLVMMRPLSSDKATVRLGTIEPGESVTASFTIAAEPQAVEKTYGIDSEIKYLDEEEDIEFSDNLKISIPLEAREEKMGIATLALVALVIVGIYLAINVIRKKDKYK